MKNVCNKCGKYKDDIDEFGYCPKCSKKIFKHGYGKRTTVEQEKFHTKIIAVSILLILIIAITLIYFYHNSILALIDNYFSASSTETESSSSSSTGITSIFTSFEDTIITEDNYEEISDEVAEKYGDEDETYYFAYACMYYTIQGALTEEYLKTEDESLLYQEIYGKTVDELISEGKKIMEEKRCYT